MGPVIGVVVILLIIVIGGLYFWSERSKNMEAQPDNMAAANDAELQAVSTQSSSDDASSIQADLNATNVDSVDAGLNQ